MSTTSLPVIWSSPNNIIPHHNPTSPPSYTITKTKSIPTIDTEKLQNSSKFPLVRSQTLPASRQGRRNKIPAITSAVGEPPLKSVRSARNNLSSISLDILDQSQKLKSESARSELKSQQRSRQRRPLTSSISFDSLDHKDQTLSKVTSLPKISSSFSAVEDSLNPTFSIGEDLFDCNSLSSQCSMRNKSRQQHSRQNSSRLLAYYTSDESDYELDEDDQSIQTLIHEESPKWVESSQKQVKSIRRMQKKVETLQGTYRQDMRLFKGYLIELNSMLQKRREGKPIF